VYLRCTNNNSDVLFYFYQYCAIIFSGYFLVSVSILNNNITCHNGTIRFKTIDIPRCATRLFYINENGFLKRPLDSTVIAIDTTRDNIILSCNLYRSKRIIHFRRRTPHTAVIITHICHGTSELGRSVVILTTDQKFETFVPLSNVLNDNKKSNHPTIYLQRAAVCSMRPWAVQQWIQCNYRLYNSLARLRRTMCNC